MMKFQLKHLSVLVSIALLSACGSGGAGSGVGDGTGSGGGGTGSGNNSGSHTAPQVFDYDRYINTHEPYKAVNTAALGKGDYHQAAAQDKAVAMSGEGVYIGLVDTGLSLSAEGIKKRTDNISKKVLDSKQNRRLVNSTDTQGHGTSMAEIILDTAPAVAINSGINSGQSVSAYVGTNNLLRAMEAGTKVDILNNSYGHDVVFDNPIQEYGRNYQYIKADPTNLNYVEFVKRGTLVLKATGNEDKKIANTGSAAPLVYPELEKGFIAVTAYNQIDYEKTQNACGELVKNWCLTVPEEFKAYGLERQKQTVIGTSNATAFLSGLAARIKSRYDWFTNEDIKNTLISTAIDKGAPGVDAVWGNGLVDANASLQGYGRFDKQYVFNVNGVKRAYFFDNNISGSGGMTKRGSDILVMNGNNTYSGDTRVEQGELVANGNSVSKHFVSSGASLTVGDSSDTIHLGALSNQGTLNVQAANLAISGDFNNVRGHINQAIGSQILVDGFANLNNSSLSLVGIRNGYVTKQGNREILMEAEGFNLDGFKYSINNAALGELIKQTIYFEKSTNQLYVNTSRAEIGDVVRNQADFTGRDKTVKHLSGLLDNIDTGKIPFTYQRDYVMPTQSLVKTLLDSKNLNRTLFGMNLFTAQHAQEQAISEQSLRGDKAIAQAVTANEQGNMWLDTGYGKSQARALADVNGESRNDSQTIGGAKRFGKHSAAVQLSRTSYRWTERYQDLEKKLNTTGVALEGVYTLHHNDYWLSLLAGFERFKAKTTYGSDKGNQYLIGLTGGKVFNFGQFSLMPSLGLQYANMTGVDYYIAQLGNDVVSANNTKTHETSAVAALDGTWVVDQQGKFRLSAGLKLRQILDGKTTYIANYGGYQVAESNKTSGSRPAVSVYVGGRWQASEHFGLSLFGGYENSKFRNNRSVNVGLNYQF